MSQQNWPPPVQPPNQPHAPPRKGLPAIVWILIAAGGVVALMIVAGIAIPLLLFVRQSVRAGNPDEPFSVKAVETPTFPQRGNPGSFGGLTFFKISLGAQGGYYTKPGHGGKILIYLPPGKHDPGSLPCVFIAGAGANMISGMLLSNGDTPEHLPYVKAGFAVVAYELDGPMSQSRNQTNYDMKRAYRAFRKAQAGLVNARNALEFTLARMPEVDPQRLYSAGHSSAGTLSLLFAEHEPRLAGCIAFAPCCDVTARLGEDNLRILSQQLDGLEHFAKKSSPITHEANLKCPVFLFHALDDHNIPVADSQACADRLKQLGKDVTLKTVPSGDHYNSMIRSGIPMAIFWLKTLERKRKGP